jgi:hypothetical protein
MVSPIDVGDISGGLGKLSLIVCHVDLDSEFSPSVLSLL